MATPVSVDWSFSASQGEINPNLWIGPDRVVLQVDRPNQLIVLRTDDGQPVARTTLAETEQLERPPLPLDDDSVLLVLDPRTVKKYDVNHGQIVWEYRESEVLPVNGPPRLFGDAERVLVLHEGHTLIRLDPATGSKRWSCPLGTEDLGERVGSMAFDEQRFYCISRWRSTVTLRAISLADGVPAWTCDWAGMEDSSWSIALSAQHVIAYPNHTGLADGFEMATDPGDRPAARDRRAGAAVPLPGDPGRAVAAGRSRRGALGDASGRRDVQDRPGRSLGGDAAGGVGPRRPRRPNPPVRRRRGRLAMRDPVEGLSSPQAGVRALASVEGEMPRDIQSHRAYRRQAPGLFHSAAGLRARRLPGREDLEGIPRPLESGDTRVSDSTPEEFQPSEDDIAAVARLKDGFDRLKAEMAKVIVGQHAVLEELLVAIFAGDIAC